MLFFFRITGAIADNFVDKRITKCFAIICDSTQILVGILAMNTMMYLIQIAFLIKMKV